MLPGCMELVRTMDGLPLRIACRTGRVVLGRTEPVRG